MKVYKLKCDFSFYKKGDTFIKTDKKKMPTGDFKYSKNKYTYFILQTNNPTKQFFIEPSKDIYENINDLSIFEKEV